MNNSYVEELKKEIEEAKTLGRSERRKQERKLQKKYNDKSIRILSNKTFDKSESLTRKQRHTLIKYKNLLKEMMKIINKYLPELTTLFSNLTDKRHKSYVTYKMRTIIMTRLFALICGITTINEMTRKFNTDETIKNLSIICNQELDEVPNWQNILEVKIFDLKNVCLYIV